MKLKLEQEFTGKKFIILSGNRQKFFLSENKGNKVYSNKNAVETSPAFSLFFSMSGAHKFLLKLVGILCVSFICDLRICRNVKL